MSWFMDLLSTFVLLILQNPLGKRCLQQGAVLPGCDERNTDFIFFAVRWDRLFRDAEGTVSNLFSVIPTAWVFLSAPGGPLTGMRENKAPRSFQCLLKIPVAADYVNLGTVILSHRSRNIVWRLLYVEWKETWYKWTYTTETGSQTYRRNEEDFTLCQSVTEDIFRWCTVDLQCHVSFRRTAKWFSCRQIDVCCLLSCSVRSTSVTPWTVAHQAPLSMGLSRQEDWRGMPCPPPGVFPRQGSSLRFLCLLFFSSLFLLQDITRSEHSSLYHTVGPCCLSFLYIVVRIC